jgi:hypothetical protein
VPQFRAYDYQTVTKTLADTTATASAAAVAQTSSGSRPGKEYRLNEARPMRTEHRDVDDRRHCQREHQMKPGCGSIHHASASASSSAIGLSPLS